MIIIKGYDIKLIKLFFFQLLYTEKDFLIDNKTFNKFNVF